MEDNDMTAMQYLKLENRLLSEEIDRLKNKSACTEPESEKKVCPVCGCPNDADDALCRMCSTYLF